MSALHPDPGAGQGRLHGVGVGPGDPDLVTMRAAALVQSCPVIAFFAKRGGRGLGRAVVERWMAPHTKVELPLIYPVTVEIPFQDRAYGEALADFYEECSTRIASHLSAGRDVALLCEGDPLFYGSFMHIHVRLRERFCVSICPGVTGMSGCWTAAAEPIAWGDDVLTVLPGTLSRQELAARLAATDAAVVMKLGRNFSKVKAALADAGLSARAIYVERGATSEQKIMPLLEKRDEEAPYFSMIILPGRNRRR